MHGPTCIFWANPTPFSLQLLYLAGFPRLASVDCHLWAAATRGDADDVVKAWLRTESGLLLDLEIDEAAARGDFPPSVALDHQPQPSLHGPLWQPCSRLIQRSRQVAALSLTAREGSQTVMQISGRCSAAPPLDLSSAEGYCRECRRG